MTPPLPATVLALSALLLVGCRKERPDAYGNFEATEVTVSAELGGQLLRFGAREGERLAAGAVVGQIDTVTLSLQRQELVSRRGAAGERTSQAQAQIGVLRAQLATARDAYERTQRLYRAEAATAQQLDQTRGAVQVLEAQIRAARAGTGAARAETGGAEAQIAQLTSRIEKGTVVNPISGTVLATYAEAGEFVQPGAPLYRIADLDTLELRAYVTGEQLGALKLGGAAEVHVDAGEGKMATLPGRIDWISSEAEFTPTPIQTRDERTALVYAVKIRVPNPPGVAKIGMPADVDFAAPAPRP
jgi:HlyD family secretion protein